MPIYLCGCDNTPPPPPPPSAIALQRCGGAAPCPLVFPLARPGGLLLPDPGSLLAWLDSQLGVGQSASFAGDLCHVLVTPATPAPAFAPLWKTTVLPVSFAGSPVCPWPAGGVTIGGTVYSTLASLAAHVATTVGVGVATHEGANGCSIVLAHDCSYVHPVSSVSVDPSVSTLTLAGCSGAAPCPLTFPLATAGGTFLANTAALVGHLNASLPSGQVAAMNGDGCSIDVSAPPGVTPTLPALGKTTVLPVSVSGSPVCPFPAGGVIFNAVTYVSLAALAAAYSATLPSGAQAQAHGDGCSIIVASGCAYAPDAGVSVTLAPTTSAVTVNVLDLDNGNAPLCPISWPVTYGMTTYANINALAAAIQSGLPSGQTAVPNPDGCRIDITYPIGGSPGVSSVGVNTRTSSTIAIATGSGDALCPIPLPVNYAGNPYATVAALAAAVQASLGAGYVVAVNPDGCRLDVSRNVGQSAPGTVTVTNTPQCTFTRFRSQDYSTPADLSAAIPATDPQAFHLVDNGTGWTVAGSTRDGFASALGAGVASEFTATFVVSGVAPGDSFYVGLRDGTTLMAPDSVIAGPATITSGVSSSTPRFNVTGNGTVTLKWNTANTPARNTNAFSLVAAKVAPGVTISQLATSCSGTGLPPAPVTVLWTTSGSTTAIGGAQLTTPFYGSDPIQGFRLKTPSQAWPFPGGGFPTNGSAHLGGLTATGSPTKLRVSIGGFGAVKVALRNVNTIITSVSIISGSGTIASGVVNTAISTMEWDITGIPVANLVLAITDMISGNQTSISATQVVY